jgi:HEAT repeat protein
LRAEISNLNRTNPLHAMPESHSSPPDSTPLDQAFTALATYDTGSSRAALVPIDEAIGASLDDAARQAALEQRLIAQWNVPISIEASSFICQKLRIVGSANAVPVLANLLTHPVLGDIARGTLEVLPCTESGDALRGALEKLGGVSKAGVVNSLGRRRDASDVTLFESLSQHQDLSIAAAAVTAIGRLGTPVAGKVLLSLLDTPRGELRLPLADASLDCASALIRTGHKIEAAALCTSLAGPGWPEFITRAARHTLEQSAGKSSHSPG